MSFDIGHLRFIDSFQFMASSLESLVENLVDEKATNKYHKFNNMERVFVCDKSMLCQKGFILMSGWMT